MLSCGTRSTDIDDSHRSHSRAGGGLVALDIPARHKENQLHPSRPPPTHDHFDLPPRRERVVGKKPVDLDQVCLLDLANNLRIVRVQCPLARHELTSTQSGLCRAVDHFNPRMVPPPTAR